VKIIANKTGNVTIFHRYFQIVSYCPGQFLIENTDYLHNTVSQTQLTLSSSAPTHTKSNDCLYTHANRRDSRIGAKSTLPGQ